MLYLKHVRAHTELEPGIGGTGGKVGTAAVMSVSLPSCLLPVGEGDRNVGRVGGDGHGGGAFDDDELL